MRACVCVWRRGAVGSPRSSLQRIQAQNTPRPSPFPVRGEDRGRTGGGELTREINLLLPQVLPGRQAVCPALDEALGQQLMKGFSGERDQNSKLRGARRTGAARANTP